MRFHRHFSPLVIDGAILPCLAFNKNAHEPPLGEFNSDPDTVLVQPRGSEISSVSLDALKVLVLSQAETDG